LLRNTLVHVARNADLKWDVAAAASAQAERPILDVFAGEISDFSRYRLAKAFLRWTRYHKATDLSEEERNQWKKLIGTINATLK
jgi:hypothetical protein